MGGEVRRGVYDDFSARVFQGFFPHEKNKYGFHPLRTMELGKRNVRRRSVTLLKRGGEEVYVDVAYFGSKAVAYLMFRDRSKRKIRYLGKLFEVVNDDFDNIVGSIYSSFQIPDSVLFEMAAYKGVKRVVEEVGNVVGRDFSFDVGFLPSDVVDNLGEEMFVKTISNLTALAHIRQWGSRSLLFEVFNRVLALVDNDLIRLVRSLKAVLRGESGEISIPKDRAKRQSLLNALSTLEDLLLMFAVERYVEGSRRYELAAKELVAMLASDTDYCFEYRGGVVNEVCAKYLAGNIAKFLKQDKSWDDFVKQAQEYGDFNLEETSESDSHEE